MRKGTSPSSAFRLRTETRIGRSEKNDLVLALDAVSSLHAVIRWIPAGRWVLRDAGSRNGTSVNGQPIRDDHALTPGDEIMFAERTEVWVLLDAGPPGLLLRPLDDPTDALIHVDMAGGLGALPSEEAPREVILRVDDAWWLERVDGEREALLDDTVVDIGGRGYRLSVPPPFVRETAEPEHPVVPWSLHAVELDIEVLPGEEEATATLRTPLRTATLGPSVPFYLLAHLARARMESAAHGGSPPGSGWVAVDRLLDALRLESPEFLTVNVFRVRKQLERTGLGNAAGIIERRRGELRCGVGAERLRVRPR